MSVIKGQTMSDYIDRKSIRNLYLCLDPNARVLVAQVLTDIDAIPSTDAVEVVRCKDCKWYNGRYCFNEKSCFPKAPNADDFCSYGEKETDHE